MAEEDSLDTYMASLEGAVAQEVATRQHRDARSTQSSADSRYRRAMRHIVAGHPFFSSASAIGEKSPGPGADASYGTPARFYRTQARPAAPAASHDKLWGEAEPVETVLEPGSGAAHLAALINTTASVPARAALAESALHLRAGPATAASATRISIASSAAALVAAAAAARSADDSPLENLIARYVAGEIIPDDELDGDDDDGIGSDADEAGDGFSAADADFDTPFASVSAADVLASSE